MTAKNAGVLVDAPLKEGGLGLVIINSPSKYYAQVDDYVIGIVKGRV